MRVLITGASGYIGSALLRSADWRVIALDDFSTHRQIAYCGLARPIRLIEGSILDEFLVNDAVREVDAVVHLAAATDAAASVNDGERYFRLNTHGTRCVAEACLQHRRPLVFVSTTSVYGPQTGTVDESLPWSQYKPQSPYAASKYAAEHDLRELYGPKGLRYVILRCGTVFGTHSGTAVGWRGHTFVNKACWQAAMDQPVTLYRGAWDSKRPYLSLGNAVRTICRAAAGDYGWGTTRNVLCGNFTPREVVGAIRKRVRDLHIREVDSPILNQEGYEVRSVYGGGPDHLDNLDHLRYGVDATLRMLRPDLFAEEDAANERMALATAA